MPKLRPGQLLLAGVFTLLWAAAAQSDDTQTLPGLTLGEAVRHVLDRGPQADAVAAELRVADAGVAIARLRPNPTLNVDAENIDGNGIYADGALRETTYSLSMPLEFGGKRKARTRVADAERITALATADATRADAVRQVTELYVDAVASERRAALYRSRTALAETAFSAAEARIRAGKASPIEAQRADVVRITAAAAAANAQRQAALAHNALVSLTGVAPTRPLQADWFDVSDASGTTDTTTGAHTSPLLAVARAEAATASTRLDAARRNRIPDVTLSAGMRRVADIDDRAAIVSISVPIPLLGMGRAAVSRAQAEFDLADARQRHVAVEQQRALDAAHVEIENARTLAQAANGPALAAAEEAVRIARVGYDGGKFSQLEFIEAERTLAETRDAAIDALQALHVARARLAWLEGRLAPITED